MLNDRKQSFVNILLLDETTLAIYCIIFRNSKKKLGFQATNDLFTITGKQPRKYVVVGEHFSVSYIVINKTKVLHFSANSILIIFKRLFTEVLKNYLSENKNVILSITTDKCLKKLRKEVSIQKIILSTQVHAHFELHIL